MRSMKTQRLFALLQHLRGRRHPVPAEAMADELGVSVRTIYRDMTALQAMGAPIRGEAGLGYQLEKGYFLPPLHFDPDELDALMLGTRWVAARGDAALSEAARRVSAKISAALGETGEDRYLRLPLRAVPRRTEENTKAAVHLGVLRSAIRNRLVLEIDYRDLQGKRSRRTAWPLGLTLFEQAWLLTVWCEVREDFRNLRVDRIRAVWEVGRRFENRRGKRFEDYLRTLP